MNADPTSDGGPSSPGVLGYLLAVGVAFVCNAVFVVADVVASNGRWVDLPFALVEVLAIEVFLGPVIAVVGVLVLHVVTRRVRFQAVHVLVAAGLGALAGWGLTAWIGDSAGDSVPWLPHLAAYVGAAAGLGRLAVVPWVWWRRARLAPQPPLRVP